LQAGQCGVSVPAVKASGMRTASALTQGAGVALLPQLLPEAGVKHPEPGWETMRLDR